MEIGSYLIVGVIVSLVAQYIKQYAGTSGFKTQAIVAALSIIAATTYYLLKDTVYWETVLAIFAFAGATYAYILKQLENK